MNASPHFQGHFEGLKAGSIRFPLCSACHRFHWYPMPRCPHCRHSPWQWQAVEGPATVYSWTVVRHAFSRELQGRVPYVVALLCFDDAPGVRFVTELIDVEPARVSIGMAVTPVFETAAARVLFRPTVPA